MEIILPIAGTTLRYPKGNLIQGFGENPGMYAVVNMKAHNGWDLVKFYGADIIAPHDGIIAGVTFQGQGYGNRIDLLSPTENGYAIMSIFGHLTEERLVKVGDEIKKGQTIGKMGNSGFVVSGGVTYWGNANPDKKGTHLHWTVKRYKSVTPQEGQGHEVWEWFGRKFLLQDENNGYAGAFDPGELMKGKKMNPNVVIYKTGSEYQLAHRATSPQGFAQQLVDAGCTELIGPDGNPDFVKINQIAHVL